MEYGCAPSLLAVARHLLRGRFNDRKSTAHECLDCPTVKDLPLGTVAELAPYNQQLVRAIEMVQAGHVLEESGLIQLEQSREDLWDKLGAEKAERRLAATRTRQLGPMLQLPDDPPLFQADVRASRRPSHRSVRVLRPYRVAAQA